MFQTDLYNQLSLSHNTFQLRASRVTHGCNLKISDIFFQTHALLSADISDGVIICNNPPVVLCRCRYNLNNITMLKATRAHTFLAENQYLWIAHIVRRTRWYRLDIFLDALASLGSMLGSQSLFLRFCQILGISSGYLQGMVIG